MKVNKKVSIPDSFAKPVKDKKIDFLILNKYILAMIVQCAKKMFLVFLILTVTLIGSSLKAQKRRKPLVLEELKIEGTIQKPEVMTILSRARFTYRTLELDVSFLKKVEKAIHTDEAF